MKRQTRTDPWASFVLFLALSFLAGEIKVENLLTIPVPESFQPLVVSIFSSDWKLQARTFQFRVVDNKIIVEKLQPMNGCSCYPRRKATTTLEDYLRIIEVVGLHHGELSFFNARLFCTEKGPYVNRHRVPHEFTAELNLVRQAAERGLIFPFDPSAQLPPKTFETPAPGPTNPERSICILDHTDFSAGLRCVTPSPISAEAFQPPMYPIDELQHPTKRGAEGSDQEEEQPSRKKRRRVLENEKLMDQDPPKETAVQPDQAQVLAEKSEVQEQSEPESISGPDSYTLWMNQEFPEDSAFASRSFFYSVFGEFGFSPVGAVFPFDSTEEVIETINQFDYMGPNENGTGDPTSNQNDLFK